MHESVVNATTRDIYLAPIHKHMWPPKEVRRFTKLTHHTSRVFTIHNSIFMVFPEFRAELWVRFDLGGLVLDLIRKTLFGYF
jgi:hypothetical protein